MQFHRFDLNLLIALDILLREKNVTRAAERAFVSQPAMSAALQKLRVFFADPLLVRVGREMELTPRAHALIEPVREALLLIQATLGNQPTFSPATVQREFTLIVSEEAFPVLLPALVRQITAEAPGIRLHTELVSQSVLGRLEYGEVDLCLCLDNLRLYEARSFPDTLRHTQLRPVHWVCAVDKNHPTVGDTITAEQFFSLPQVFGRPSGYSVSAEELVHRILDVDFKVHLTVPSLLHLPLVLPGTNFVATLPERVARVFAQTVAMKIFPMPFPTPATHEVLVWHKRNDMDPAHTWLRERVIQLAGELP